MMHWVDWSIIVMVAVFIVCMGLTTKKYTRSVADFLAANRCAGRYILGVAEGEAAMGAITVIVLFELFLKTGLTKIFWDWVTIPIGLIVTLTGFVIYRYRETRAMTLGQFFEIRYSRRFRIFAGILSWVSGVINFGIFPGIGARFFMNYCGFKSIFWNIGPVEIDLMLALFMLILLSLALFFTFIGGQIAVLVTDFCQGLVAVTVFISIIIFIGIKFPWTEMSSTLISLSQPGQSLVDPMDIADKTDFNFSFFAILCFFGIYHRMAWQGSQGYNCSAVSPHEAKMSKVVGEFKKVLVVVGLIAIPLAAITVLNHPKYSSMSETINQQLQNTFPGNVTLQGQMTVPVALSHILPIGLSGAFVASMLGFFISTNNTYMHSWGSIFIQDIVCIIRKKPMSNKQHMLCLRLSIVFVAAFAFLFSLLFPLKEYIWMFQIITGAIFLGGAGAVIIGGLYWKHGTAAGAYAAMIVGSFLSVATIVLRTVWENIPFCVEHWGNEMPINSHVMSFLVCLAAIIAYVAISLLDKTGPANMGKILHRGKYAQPDLNLQNSIEVKPQKQLNLFWRLLGVNSKEFSTLDKGLYLYTLLSSSWWFGNFLLLSTLSICGYMTPQRWSNWWFSALIIMTVIAFTGSIWTCIGGLFDLRRMYSLLSKARIDFLDDGRVPANENDRDNINTCCKESDSNFQ